MVTGIPAAVGALSYRQRTGHDQGRVLTLAERGSPSR